MTTDRLRQFIRSSAWGKDLTELQLRRVQSESFETRASAGQVICHQGVRADYWYGVMEGLVKASNVCRNGRPTTFIGVPAGGWFGEGAVLKNELRPYDGVALRDSTLVLVPASTFHWLLDTSLPFNRFLIDQLNARLAQFIVRLEHRRSHDPDKHVAHCLAELFNSRLYPGMESTIEVSQEEIAYLAGVSRQLVNRALRHLEEKQLLSVQYGAITILDVAAFCAFAREAEEAAGK
ncbi:MAG: Crp/Fnr family transcriptional regulator [Noviherbaspirillum sp.]